MTVLQVQTAHRVLVEYSNNIGKSIGADRLKLPIRAGVYDVQEPDMLMEAGMSFTRKQLADACIFLTTFDLLTDEGEDFPPSKYGDIHRYKITKNGIVVANHPGGLEDIMLDRGNVIFTKLTQMTNQQQNNNSIANTFINSPVNQLQQGQNNTDTNLSQSNSVENSTNNNAKVSIKSELSEKRKTFKDILNQWWWAFLIPIAIGIILLAIEYKWFA